MWRERRRNSRCKGIVACREAVIHQPIANEGEAGAMAVIAGVAQLEAIAARQPRRAAAPDRSQAVQSHALVEHLRTVLGAQPPGVHDRKLPGPHGGVPEQAGDGANREREQCLVHGISAKMHGILSERDFRQG